MTRPPLSHQTSKSLWFDCWAGNGGHCPLVGKYLQINCFLLGSSVVGLGNKGHSCILSIWVTMKLPEHCLKCRLAKPFKLWTLVILRRVGPMHIRPCLSYTKKKGERWCLLWAGHMSHRARAIIWKDLTTGQHINMVYRAAWQCIIHYKVPCSSGTQWGRPHCFDSLEWTNLVVE